MGPHLSRAYVTNHVTRDRAPTLGRCLAASWCQRGPLTGIPGRERANGRVVSPVIRPERRQGASGVSGGPPRPRPKGQGRVGFAYPLDLHSLAFSDRHGGCRTERLERESDNAQADSPFFSDHTQGTRALLARFIKI